MIDINELVTKNFQDNITYLEKEHPKVFDKLAALDSAVANKHYTEKYELLYENSYFDVLEVSTKKLLYAQNSREFAKLVSQRVDNNPNIDTFECFENISISKEDKETISKEEEYTSHLSNLVNILCHVQEENNKEKKVLAYLDKFIFFGTGLGVHIDEVHKKISAKSYLIVEDNLELFRLSLFVINYKNVADEAKLYFSIFDSEHDFSSIAKEFLNNEYYLNSYIKYFIMLNHSANKRDEFHREVISQPHLTYKYHSILTQSLKPLDSIIDGYKFINKKLPLLNKDLDSAPFLLLAAGPSLQENRQWLQENYQNFIIVAISAVLPLLEKENISPDIIVHLEGASHALKLFNDIKSFEFTKESICLFSSKTPLEVLELFSKEQLYLFENSTNYKEDSLKLMAPCVGSISHQLLVLLNVQNIYLLGLDLAVNRDGKTHIEGHTRAKILDTDAKNSMKYEKDLINIRGNYKDTVQTTLQYKASIDAIGFTSKLFQNKKQNIYNLNSGAYLSGTTPRHTKGIVLKGLDENIRTSLHLLLQKDSTTGLSKKDLTSLNDKLNEAKKVKDVIKKLQNSNNIQSLKFLEELQSLSLYITDKSSSLEYELYTVLDNYLKNILPNIFNYFNRLDKKESNDLNIIFCTSIIEIIGFYIRSIEKLLKEGINK